MKRRKKIHPPVKAPFRVPVGTQYTGLKALFREAGLIDDHDRPTDEGSKALRDPQ